METGQGGDTTTSGLVGHDGQDRLAGLADLLVAGLDALAKAGQAEAASRAAGKACALMRDADPPQWRKFNALLHRLSGQVPQDRP